MAEVYLAKCFGVAGFERLVALKRILPTIAEDDEFIAMFIDEAKIAGQLSHAHIAQIFDLGKIHNSYFIAMEYVSGHDLRALWDRSREGGGLPLELACHVVQRLCEGLDYAHRRRDNRGRPLGIIHRDVSPQNVLLSYDGDVKIIDFGIAKAANRMVRTQTGILKGKFAYMAPEQARGEPTDHRADIFAIGVILYELLTGERAFKADSDYALLEKVRRVDIVPPRKLRAEVPRELEKIVYKAMSKDAGDRYAWASAMAADLDRFLGESDLVYSKEELSAFVRRTFRKEHAEEQRRLKTYEAWRDASEPAGADPDVTSKSEVSSVSAENATVVRSDPSGGSRPSEAGTAVEAEVQELPSRQAPSDRLESTRAESSALLVAQPREAPTSDDESEVSEDGSEGFAAGYTLPIDALPNALQAAARRPPTPAPIEDQTNPDRERPSERVARLISSGDLLPWDGDEPAPGKAVGQSTEVNVSRPDFSAQAEALVDDTVDATMVDSNPVPPSEEAPALARGERERRREGTRPDVRGSSLGQVLGGPTPSATTQERPRPVTAALTLPPLLQEHERTPPKNGASRPQTRAATEVFEDRAKLAAPRRMGPVVAGVAAAALLAGVVLGGTLVTLLAPPSAGTFIVVTPGPAQVGTGEAVLCDRTPCAVDLPPGKHELVFSREGVGVVSRTIEIGAPPNIVNVRLSPRLAGLRLVTNPSGASVWLDGQKLEGTTPMTLPELTVGEMAKLKIALNDEFDVVEELFEVEDLGGAPLAFDLPARQTRWDVRAEPDDAVLFVPGQRPRAGRLKQVVARGESRVVVARRPGCEERALPLAGNGKPLGEAPVALSCRLFDGRISVSGPRGAEVEIDGIPLARRVPVREFPVPAGEHVVVVHRRGRHAPYVVEVEAGQTVGVAARLR